MMAPVTPPAAAAPPPSPAAIAGWSALYMAVAFAIGFACSYSAVKLSQAGNQGLAQAVVVAPEYLVPLLTVVLFALFAKREGRPLWHAVAFFVLITLIALGGQLWLDLPLRTFLWGAAQTLLWAAIGTAIGRFFQPEA